MRLIAFHRQRIDHAHLLGEPTKAPHIAPTARGPPREEDEGNTFALSEPLEYEFDQRVSW
jgi:hypothetical protein